MKINYIKYLVWLTVCLLGLGLAVQNFSQPNEMEILKHKDSPTGAKQAFEYYQMRWNAGQSYENSWKLAKFAHFYSYYYLHNLNQRNQVIKVGIAAAKQAIKLNSQGVEAYFFLGICDAAYAEFNGIFEAAGVIKETLDALSKAIALDPKYYMAQAYVLRARIYSVVPGWPFSSGDHKKAEEDYLAAFKHGGAGKNRYLYAYYGEFLLSTNRKKEALKIIEEGLALPRNYADPTYDLDALRLLTEAQKKIR